MDAIDRKILQVLRADARTSVAELARLAGVSRVTAHDRLKRLQSDGILLGTTIRVDPAAVGKPLRAFLFVTWQAADVEDQREVAAAIAELSGVVNVHIVTGKHDFLVEVVAKDMDAVGRLIIEQMRAIPGVSGTESSIAFWSIEGTGALEG
jgi:Lrp/AsnC family leucine-responsive transcriptional regulator